MFTLIAVLRKTLAVRMLVGILGLLLMGPTALAQTGACCIGTTCTLRTLSFCTSSGGEFFGGVCSPNPCAVSGRCCSLGNCTFVADSNCSGVWTQGGSCFPNPCPPPNGACCLAGGCTLTTQANCTGGATWTISAFCWPNPCPPAPCGIGIPNRFGGETRAAAIVSNGGLLVARGTNLEILDLSNAAAPVAFFPPRRIGLPALAVKIAYTPGFQRAFVLLENGDVTFVTTAGSPLDITHPTTISAFDAVDIEASGETVYVANLSDTSFFGTLSTSVGIWQRGANDQAVFVSRIHPFLQNYEIQRVVRVGNILWLAMHEHNSFVLGIEGWDISNPALPSRVTSSLNFSSPGFNTDVHAITAIGNTLFLASLTDDPNALRYDSIRAIDVSVPSAPVWRPAVNLTDFVYSMAASGTQLRIAMFGVVQTWNAANPASLSLMGTYSDPQLVVKQIAPGAAAMATDYWAAGSRGLLTMNVANPASMSVRTTAAIVPAHASAARQSGTSTIVIDSSSNTLRVFDYSLLESQQLRGSAALPGFSSLLEVPRVNNGTQQIACAAGNSISIVDVSTPTAPTLRTTIPISARMIAAAGDRLYAFTHARELVVISIASPASPVVMSTTTYGGTESDYSSMVAWETGGGATRAVALGTQTFGLWIINTTTGASPLVSSIYNPAPVYQVHGLAKGPNNLYVSASESAFDNSLESLDVSNLASPIVRYTSSFTSGAGTQGVFGALSYIASPAGRFLVGVRPDQSADFFKNDIAIFEAPASGNEGVLYRIFTQTLPDALNFIAPSADGSRAIIPANYAGLYQVAMPQTWAPGFSSPPPFTARTACRGGVITLSVSASANPTAITHQWFRSDSPTVALINGTRPWGSIVEGATSPNLTITNIHSQDLAGRYFCVATNSCGSTISNSIGLTMCAADFNCSSGITVQDIFDFLAAWFSSNPLADFNGIGGITVQDIFDFLAAWFAGCL